MRAVFVKGAAMTGAHEQVRLLEPANWAAEMRAVNGEDLKLLPLDSPHPARDISGHPIPWPRVRIAVGRKPRLTNGEAFQRAERDPGIGWSFAPEAGKHKAYDRNAYERRGDHVERGSKL